MQTKIIAIGNSKGVRIPKPILEECRLQDSQTVDISVVDETIMIRPVKNPRKGWADAAQALADAGNDEDAWKGLSSELRSDEEEWTW